MRKLLYYTPIIRTIASNGSERFGAQAITKVWEPDGHKMEVTMNGKTREEAQTKLNKFLSDGVESEEMICEYYLCTQSVVDFFKPFEVSKPFKSGYSFDSETNYYAVWLHFPEIDKQFKEVIEPANSELIAGEEIDFMAFECIAGQMDVSKISLKSAKKDGLFSHIENVIGLTKDRNRAMTIFNIAQQYGITPVELINKMMK